MQFDSVNNSKGKDEPEFYTKISYCAVSTTHLGCDERGIALIT